VDRWSFTGLWFFKLILCNPYWNDFLLDSVCYIIQIVITSCDRHANVFIFLTDYLGFIPVFDSYSSETGLVGKESRGMIFIKWCGRELNSGLGALAPVRWAPSPLCYRLAGSLVYIFGIISVIWVELFITISGCHVLHAQEKCTFQRQAIIYFYIR